jgi:uncharacterized protein (TIGR02145 family)
MKTVRFLGLLLISFMIILISGAYCNNFPIKNDAGSETSDGDNKYSPAGKWLSIKNTVASQGAVKLFVPDFIFSCHSRLLDPAAGPGQYNDVLVYSNSRRTLYKDLFLEIMLMTTSGSHQFEYEISKPLNTYIKEANYAIKMLGEIKVIPKSSNLFKELPVQLKLVGLLFTVQDKVNEAGAEAASIYTSLLAFRDFRYKFLKSQITKNSYYDPDMLVGLELAYNELIGMQTIELASLKKQLEINSGLESASGGLVKIAVGIQFGKVVSAIAGGGLLGVSLATAAETAWFWQLDRTYDAKKAEASVVLLSSIDRTLFESIKPSVSPADIYSTEQMHTHLSNMIYEAANVYNNKSSVQYNFKLPMRAWINEFPYYNIAELASIKQKAINDIEILPPDKDQIASNNSGFFIDTRDGHKYKTVKIGTQVWMAENLAYKAVKGCYAFDDNPVNVRHYGYLYNYETAVNVCPSGWHLPTDNEWKLLEKDLGMNNLEIEKVGDRGDGIGSKLKSKTGWENNGNGNNVSGFSALPAGLRCEGFKCTEGTFIGLGSQGRWFSSTMDLYGPWIRGIYSDTRIERSQCYESNGSSDGYSVRCIKNILGNTSKSFEPQIKKLLIEGGRIDKDDELKYNYHDLNDDGINEVVVYNYSVSGNQVGQYFIYLTNPLKMILDLDGYPAYVISNSTSNGFKDIKGVYKNGDYNLFKWDGNEYSILHKPEIEYSIIELMSDELILSKDFPTKKGCVWFEYNDLNEDGNEEVFVWNYSLRGAQNLPIDIWQTEPLKRISEPFYGDRIEISETLTCGYRNVKIFYYVSGQAYTPSLRGKYFDLRWDKSKKMYVEVK